MPKNLEIWTFDQTFRRQRAMFFESSNDCWLTFSWASLERPKQKQNQKHRKDPPISFSNLSPPKNGWIHLPFLKVPKLLMSTKLLVASLLWCPSWFLEFAKHSSFDDVCGCCWCCHCCCVVVVDVAFILSSFLSTADSFQCTNIGDKTLTLVY